MKTNIVIFALIIGLIVSQIMSCFYDDSRLIALENYSVDVERSLQFTDKFMVQVAERMNEIEANQSENRFRHLGDM